MVGDGILDDTQELLLRVGGANRQTVQQLDHQTSKAFESSRNANRGRHLNQDTFGGVDVNLKFASLVDRRVEQGEKTLVSMVSMLNADMSRARWGA